MSGTISSATFQLNGRPGPLSGLRVIEMAGLGPGPFCGMLLADLGAEVLRITRPGEQEHITTLSTLQRGKSSLELDLKSPESIASLLDLIAKANVLIEGYRPGVMERLGIGPEPCLHRNPALVYGRMTGWGQEGPMACAAGHDLNYIALSGALAAIGTKDLPVAPLNLVGDFGGGALYLAVGILAALRNVSAGGVGQVIDAAMYEGAAHLMTPFYGLFHQGRWNLERGTNFVDGGAHFYRIYKALDGRWWSVAAIEPQFYTQLVQGLDVADLLPVDAQWDQERWHPSCQLLNKVFASLSTDELMERFEGKDACVFPLYDMASAPSHPHCVARGAFVEIEGIVQPRPVPRFSATPAATPIAAAAMPAGEVIAKSWGAST